MLLHRLSTFWESTLHRFLSSQETAGTTLAHLRSFCNTDSSISSNESGLLFVGLLSLSSLWLLTKASFSFLSQILTLLTYLLTSFISNSTYPRTSRKLLLMFGAISPSKKRNLRHFTFYAYPERQLFWKSITNRKSKS